MACAICEIRRPRRFCPGVSGDICTLCCGQEREVTVSCPLDCEYLQDARRHDKPVAVDPESFPNRDIRVTDAFIRENEALVIAVSRTLVSAALGSPGTVDNDVREALDGLTRTYRTLQSGVYYESRPANPLAARVYGAIQEGVQQFRQAETQHAGISKTRDADVLGVVVFLQRVELDRNNGRPRGRAFLDFLRGFYPPEPAPVPETTSRLIVP